MTFDVPTLLYAYCNGIFPMAEDDDIYWYDPDPRAILPLERFHVSRSLRRALKREPFTIRINHNFRRVMELCAAPGGETRQATWISPLFVERYTELHRSGYAHSVEAYRGDELVGGLYGVAVNSFFAGESMFSRVTDASKVALVHLVRRLQTRDFQLLDVQFLTPHLERFGAIEIPRADYHARLARALARSNSFA